MTDNKHKRLSKLKHSQGGVESVNTNAKKFRIGDSSSEVEGEKKHDTKQNEAKDDNNDQGEMEKIEALCKQFGVPDPGELYVIPRDFSGNPNVTQYDLTMPDGLARWIDEAEFEFTIGKINFYFAKADEVDCKTVMNSICKFLTCFLIRTCQKTKLERTIIRVKNFIIQQNQDVYHPKGFHIVEPAARGLRHLEFRSITYYSMKYFLEHEEEVAVTETEANTHHIPHPHNVVARRSVMSHF